MSLDDIVLALQRVVDRLIRRSRLGAAPPQTRRRLLVVQIDGLSRAVLERALAGGRMPFTRHLLARHGFQLTPMTVGMPTSTPAFQMAAMYGVRPDIPGFHYYDKRRRADIHFPRAGHAARVEAEQTTGHRGILRGGSAYGCVFTGEADNDLFSFTRLRRPSGEGLLRVLSAFVVLGWVVVKSAVRTIVELGRALLRLVADPLGASQGWRWLTIKIGLSVWVRELFTLAVSRDLYAGVPAVYVNYLDYDVSAHAFGPASRRALASLRRVDHSIHQLWRILRRVPGHRYDLYVLSDHGQAQCTPFATLTGRPLEQLIFEEYLRPPEGVAAVQPPGPRRGLGAAVHAYRHAEKGLFQHFLNYLEQDFWWSQREHEAHEEGGVRVISAGPNAFLYVTDVDEPLGIEELEGRFPGLAEEISRGKGVGFVLARAAGGPVCFWRGKRCALTAAEPGPFAGRDDLPVVLAGLADLMAMRSAGDLVIYGIDAREGHVSFIGEVGAHAGPSRDELHTFVLRPPNATLPASIDHPIELYPHLVRYGEAA